MGTTWNYNVDGAPRLADYLVTTQSGSLRLAFKSSVGTWHHAETGEHLKEHLAPIAYQPRPRPAEIHRDGN